MTLLSKYEKNAEMMERYFSLNFNRQGTCLNMRDSSIYDLSRLQSRQYFSTNHLMMRIWDDTGHRVMFRLGDERKERIGNAEAEWRNTRKRGIILTTMPYGQAKIRLLRELPKNLELTVRLQGNMVGQQALIFRADENGENGITIRLHDNVLYLEEGEGEKALLELSIFYSLTAVRFCPKCRKNITASLHWRTRSSRMTRMKTAFGQRRQNWNSCEGLLFRELQTARSPSSRNWILTMKTTGFSESIWKEPAFPAGWTESRLQDGLRVGTGAGNNLFLEAEVTRGSERFSQTNLSDDVYDGIFNCLSITDLEGRASTPLRPSP